MTQSHLQIELDFRLHINYILKQGLTKFELTHKKHAHPPTQYQFKTISSKYLEVVAPAERDLVVVVGLAVRDLAERDPVVVAPRTAVWLLTSHLDVGELGLVVVALFLLAEWDLDLGPVPCPEVWLIYA